MIKNLAKLMVLSLMVCGFVMAASHQITQVNAENTSRAPLTSPITAFITGKITFGSFYSRPLPVQYATVHILNSKTNQIVEIVETDKSGVYRATVKNGTYTIIPQKDGRISTYMPELKVFDTATQSGSVDFVAKPAK